jgi:hypothetical protein
MLFVFAPHASSIELGAVVEYQTFAKRDPSEYEIIYLFVR